MTNHLIDLVSIFKLGNFDGELYGLLEAFEEGWRVPPLAQNEEYYFLDVLNRSCHYSGRLKEFPNANFVFGSVSLDQEHNLKVIKEFEAYSSIPLKKAPLFLSFLLHENIAPYLRNMV